MELEKDAQIEIEMLRRKEKGDLDDLRNRQLKLDERIKTKEHIQY
jgi:hypothetical protein